MSTPRLTNARLLDRETLSSQVTKSTMTPEDFDEVLLWLGSAPDGAVVPNRDRGAEKYEKLRQRIIRIYRARGCSRADEIADESLERFASKAKKLRLRYTGDPALYIYAIAKKVYREILRAESQTITQPPAR